LRSILLALVLASGPFAGAIAFAQTCERPREGIGRPKIVGGLMADIRDWPWQVALRTRSPANGSLFYFCGATIIDPTTVLTAAHCVADLVPAAGGFVDANGSLIEAVIGVADLKKAAPDRIRSVTKVKVHETYAQAYPKYKEETAQSVGNDIALLTLSTPWSGPFARLSLTRQTDPTNPPGGLLAVAGYGLQVASKLGGASITYRQVDGTAFAAGSDRLQEVGIDLISDSTCLADTGGSSLPTGQLCAGTEFGGHDSCSGDSGGPLVAFDPEGCTYQIGVVSSGPADCAQAHAYGLYTRVSDFTDWIRRDVPDAVEADQSSIAAGTDAAAPQDAVETAQAQLADVIAAPTELAAVRVREGETLKVGSTVTLEVSSKISGRLLLVDIDPSGQVTQIYPNKFSRGRDIAAGQTLAIDGSEAGFVFRATEPAGEGRVLAIVGPGALDPSGLVGAQARGKGISVEASPVTYLSQLIQMIGRARTSSQSRPQSGPAPPEWAFATVSYIIGK
jgi:secreted trypsin-like serine protease